MSINFASNRIWYSALAFAIVIRFAVAPFTGHPYDLGIWMSTGRYVAQGKSPYDLHPSIGYPPLWALWCALSFVTSNTIAPQNQFAYIFLIKLPIILADFVIALMLLRTTVGRLSFGRYLAVLYLLNPYVLIVGVVWGMMDNLVSLLVIASILALNARKSGWSGFLIASAVAVKLYPVLLLPLMVAFLVRDRHVRKLIIYVITFIMTSLLAIVFPLLIFGWSSGGLIGVGVSQLARSPGAIAPLAIFHYLTDTGVVNLGLVSVSVLDEAVILRLLWIPSLILCTFFILWSRRVSSSPATMMLEFSLLYAVYLVSAPSISEQLFELFLVFLLFTQAFAGLKNFASTSYAIGSCLVLIFITLHVPITSFVFPILTVDRTPLANFGKSILPLLLLAFTAYLAVEIGQFVKTIRSIG